MIERTTDASFLNEVVNHPTVRPFMHAPDGELDLTPMVTNPANLTLVGEHGGMIFVQHVSGTFEIHTQVLPSGRGAWALEMAHAAVDWLFCRTGAVEVFTRVPEGNVGAMALARACGAKPEQKVTQILSGVETVVEIYGGRIQDWLKIAPGLVERGKRFHEMLKERAEAAGVKIDHHPEDAWHDRHVGAAAGMILGGQAYKGCFFFNRWAAMAIAPPVKLLSLDPVVIDITDCRIAVTGDDFEVIPNRVH